MSEGTKLGEFAQTDEFKSAIRRETDAPQQDSQATRIGQLSEFERSLMSDDGSFSAHASQSKLSKEDEFSSNIDFFQNELDRLVVDYEEGDIIEGTVRRIEKSGVMVDINFKSDGFVSNSEFSYDSNQTPENTLKPGDKIRVVIVKLESKEGYTVLSKKRADYELAWGEMMQFSKSRHQIEISVTSKVQGGLVAEYQGIRGFVPASQVAIDNDEDLDKFIGKKMTVCVLQVDRRRKKVIFSAKQATGKNSKEEAARLLETLEVGQVRDGRVTSVKEFGVFVDLGGLEGLVHISELSWSRVVNPNKLVTIGQDVKVFVLGVDRETGRVSLGMKQLEQDPWVNVAHNFQVGQVVQGTITRIVTFGAFMQIANNLEGLIHISELSNSRVEKVEDVVKTGQVVEAKIVKLVPEEQKIGLSIKALSQSASPAASQQVVEESATV